MSNALGESDYRRAGMERLRDSWILLQNGQYSGCVYLGGRAIESMLRAIIWKHDREIQTGKKALDTGHNLRDMLTLVAKLGVLKSYEHQAALATDVQTAGRLWFNNMRFVPTAKMKTLWWKLGEIGSKRTLKPATLEYYNLCSAIVKRCEVLCQD